MRTSVRTPSAQWCFWKCVGMLRGLDKAPFRSTGGARRRRRPSLLLLLLLLLLKVAVLEFLGGLGGSEDYANRICVRNGANSDTIITCQLIWNMTTVTWCKNIVMCNVHVQIVYTKWDRRELYTVCDRRADYFTNGSWTRLSTSLCVPCIHNIFSM